jgi:replicative DNA helicase
MGNIELPENETEKLSIQGIISLQQFINQTFNLEKNTSSKQQCPESNEIFTQFLGIDEAIGSLIPGNLYCVAVKPGKGKTAFLLSLAKNIAIKESHSIAIFSPERSSSKLIQRIIESETSSSFSKIVSDFAESITDQKTNDLIDRMNNASFYIDDSSFLSPDEIESKTELLHNKYNVNLIFVDNIELYAQHIHNLEKNSEEHDKLMKRLKEIAIKFNIPVIAFSQISNSKFLNDPSAVPCLENIPPFITEHCDSIMILHRPSIIQFNKPEYEEWKGHAKIFVVRHPDGKANTSIRLKYIEKTDSFTNEDAQQN